MSGGMEKFRYAKFRGLGIGEELSRNYCILFGPNVAMGRQATTSGMSTVASDGYILESIEVASDGYILESIEEPEESSGDLEEERRKRAAATIDTDFVTELDDLFLTGAYSQQGGTTVTSGSGGTSNRQVKEGGFMGSLQFKRSVNKGKKKASKANLIQEELKNLRESFNTSMESRNSFYRSYTQQNQVPSIKETMDCVKNLDGMVVCNELWYKATKLFVQDAAREMFWAQPSDEAKLGYIVAYDFGF